MPERECEAFGTEYDPEDATCKECADAEKCEAAMKPWECPEFGEFDPEDPTCAECEEKKSCQEEAKPDLPSPKKRKKGSTPGGRIGNMFQ